MKSDNVGAFNWKIEKIVKKGSYNYAVVRNHPRASKHGYVLHHRVVMENHMKRLLNTDEVIHHKNGDKKDNRIENLQVMTVSEHSKRHSSVGRAMLKLRCPWCGLTFVREKRQTHIAKGGRYTCCSASCRGKLSRNIQLNRETVKMEEAISGNIVMEFNSNDNPEETSDKGIRRDYTLPT